MVVSEGGGEAGFHAEVAYTTQNGTLTMTDDVFLRAHRCKWRIDQ